MLRPVSLPDPELCDCDWEVVYVKTHEDRLERARAAWWADRTFVTANALRGAIEALRAAKLAVWGVDCPMCKGSGADPRSYVDFCGLCAGEGAVLPHIAKKYGENR